jgi:hypothetical protein
MSCHPLNAIFDLKPPPAARGAERPPVIGPRGFAAAPATRSRGWNRATF